VTAPPLQLTHSHKGINEMKQLRELKMYISQLRVKIAEAETRYGYAVLNRESAIQRIQESLIDKLGAEVHSLTALLDSYTSEEK